MKRGRVGSTLTRPYTLERDQSDTLRAKIQECAR